MSLPPPAALARPLDFRFSSNRLAALGLLGVTLLARRRGRAWPEALSTGGLAFLAWSLARELDPDHPQTANAALPVAGAALLAGRGVSPAALWPALATLSGLRLTAGTTGQPATRTDQAALLGQSLLAAGCAGRVGALVAGAAPFLSAGSGSPVPLMGALWPAVVPARGGSWWGAALALAALPLAGTLVAPEEVRSSCDRAPYPVGAGNVQRARQLAVLALGAGLLSRQTRSLLPLAAACLTVAARRAAGQPAPTPNTR